jgi:hypothetical protein
MLAHGVSQALGLGTQLLALSARGLNTLLMVLQLLAVGRAVQGLLLSSRHGKKCGV